MNETSMPGPDAASSGLPSTSLPTAAASLEEGAQTVIGRFRLLEKLGEGGFGAVFVAEQKHPIKRRVALKIIKLGMDTREVIARFEAERQALAMMDHPNIAKVYDAGATDTGRPYFVMELVRGIPITEYCDQNNCPPIQRLKLFIDVCNAIQHAHQKGVIHRDIKPSNILVTLHDGTPVPKVIDFGIAKATQGDLTDKTIYTQFQQFVGTPAYMSPEQAEMSALDVDTRSDIYSLGVLLYELLTGMTPFDGKELLKAGVDEMRRRIRETDPMRPSNRLSGMTGVDSTSTAKRRGMEAHKLVTLLRGDLDWIVMKCLEKDRTRRYETANGLAVDIKRHLNNEPITARPPSSSYRFQKWARRNKLVFGATAAVLLALLLGISFSTWQAIRATAARAREAEQRQVAQSNEKKAIDAEANAVAARARAQAQELIARRRAYASDMNVAMQAVRENNLGYAQDLLDRQRPQAGDSDLRGWEWRYLWGQTRTDASFTLCQQPAEIGSLAVSPDGLSVAIGSFHPGGLSVWDLRTRQEVCRLVKEETRVRAAFSPTEPLIAFAGSLGNLHLWNTSNRQMVAEWPLEGRCTGLAFSVDGRTLLTSTKLGHITLWRVRDGTKEANYSSDTAGIPLGNEFAATPDLRLAAESFGEPQRQIRVIDLRSGKELWARVAADLAVTALALSPDGKMLASAAGYAESDIRLWNIATGQQIGQFQGHGSWVSSMVFSADGMKLTSGSADQTIRIWDVASRKCLDVLRGHRQEVWRLAMLPDGKTLVSGGKDGTVCFWDTSITHSKQPRISLPENVRAWCFEPNSRSVLTLSSQGRVSRWTGTDFQWQDPLLEMGTTQNDRWSSLFSKDGTLLACGSDNGIVHVWDVPRRVLAHQWTAAKGAVYPSLFFADGNRLITDDDDNLSREWNIATGAEIQAWPQTGTDALSPNQTMCMTIDYAGNAIIRDLAGKSQRKVEVGILETSQTRYSPDGTLFAVSSDLGFSRVFESASWRQVAYLGGLLNAAHSVSFSPDGTRLVIGSGAKEAMRMYDTQSWQDVITLEGSGFDNQNQAFSSDGNSIGWLNSSQVLQIWQAPSWEQIAQAEAKQTPEMKHP